MASRPSPSVETVYHALARFFGPRRWWPGDSPFEIMVGAILTQNTAWKNVEKAIANLKADDILHPERMRATSRERLAELIRPSGYFNQKAIKLHAYLDYYVEAYGARHGAMRGQHTPLLREQLLSVHGVGPETADSILLYALDHPVFVIDAYTLRSGRRLGWFTETTTYVEAQDFFHGRLPEHVPLYNEYHALFVALGHHYCKPTPRCALCPLQTVCPAGSTR